MGTWFAPLPKGLCFSCTLVPANGGEKSDTKLHDCALQGNETPFLNPSQRLELAGAGAAILGRRWDRMAAPIVRQCLRKVSTESHILGHQPLPLDFQPNS